jgi:hypothetical protein
VQGDQPQRSDGRHSGIAGSKAGIRIIPLHEISTPARCRPGTPSRRVTHGWCADLFECCGRTP